MYPDRQACVNSVDPDQAPQKAASDQGLHGLLPVQHSQIKSTDNKMDLCKKSIQEKYISPKAPITTAADIFFFQRKQVLTFHVNRLLDRRFT